MLIEGTSLWEDEKVMKEITIAITAASYSGNKGAAAMLQSSIRQLYEIYGEGLNINLISGNYTRFTGKG